MDRSIAQLQFFVVDDGLRCVSMVPFDRIPHEFCRSRHDVVQRKHDEIIKHFDHKLCGDPIHFSYSGNWLSSLCGVFALAL